MVVRNVFKGYQQGIRIALLDLVYGIIEERDSV